MQQDANYPFWGGKAGVDLLAVRTLSFAESRSTVQLINRDCPLSGCVHISEGSVEISGQQWQCSLEKERIKLWSFLFQNLFSEIRLHALLLKWTKGNKPCFFGWPKSVFSQEKDIVFTPIFGVLFIPQDKSGQITEGKVEVRSFSAFTSQELRSESGCFTI